MSTKFKYKSKSDGFMSDTPLAIDRETATIYINHNLYDKLSLFEKKFWMLHEKGHYFLNTDDEIKADAYAFDRLAGTEVRSLKQMVEALENLLNDNNSCHHARIEALYQRALRWDREHPVKATSKQIDALGDAMTQNMQVLVSGMIGLNQSTGNIVQEKDNSLIYIIAIIVIGVGVLIYVNR